MARSQCSVGRARHKPLKIVMQRAKGNDLHVALNELWFAFLVPGVAVIGYVIWVTGGRWSGLLVAGLYFLILLGGSSRLISWLVVVALFPIVAGVAIWAGVKVVLLLGVYLLIGLVLVLAEHWWRARKQRLGLRDW